MPLLISVRQTLSCYGKESVSLSTVLSNMSFVLLMLLLTVFVSPLSEIAAPNLRSLSKACISHKTITKIARLCQKIMFLSDWKLLGR